MAYHLEPFADVGLDEDLLAHLIGRHESVCVPEYERYWRYYRNPAQPAQHRDDVNGTMRWGWDLAQMEGLPARLRDRYDIDGQGSQREVVIENDIGWRVQSIVEYMAGRKIAMVSKASRASAARRAQIEEVVTAILEANGGLQWIHDLALLGSVYGHVDILIRTAEAWPGGQTNAGGRGNRAALPSEPSHEPGGPSESEVLSTARKIRMETVEAPRAIPLLSPHDYRRVDAYVLRYTRLTNEIERSGKGDFLSRLANWMQGAGGATDGSMKRGTAVVTEILSASHRQVYEDEELVVDGVNPLGVLPVVHIQNQSQPYYWEGISEVEALIPLQDELNTRLSDRANRVTLQCFKMYLARGIDGFADRPVAPGQMWMTDNTEASIESFGGDAESPSEEAHIREIHEALDKTSAVTALAAGNLPARVGALSSENAMRISLLGILSKTERKRRLYGEGISQAMRLALTALDAAGVFATSEEERRIEVAWGGAIPFDDARELVEAALKRKLGVRGEDALAELGYSARETGP